MTVVEGRQWEVAELHSVEGGRGNGMHSAGRYPLLRAIDVRGDSGPRVVLPGTSRSAVSRAIALPSRKHRRDVGTPTIVIGRARSFLQLGMETADEPGKNYARNMRSHLALAERWCMAEQVTASRCGLTATAVSPSDGDPLGTGRGPYGVTSGRPECSGTSTGRICNLDDELTN